MRALFAVLVSFQLAACVAGDNTEPTETPNDPSEVDDPKTLVDSIDIGERLDQLREELERAERHPVIVTDPLKKAAGQITKQ